MDMLKKAALAAAAAVTAGSAVAGTVLFNEGFDTGAPAGWAVLNYSDFPSGPGWFQGYDSPAPFFPAHSGPANSYLASSVYIGAQTPSGDPAGYIDGYLVSPEIALDRDMVLNFWTRTVANSSYSDYLWVGLYDGVDFTVLLEINPELAVGAYPEVWTQYTLDVARLAPGTTGSLIINFASPDASRSGNYVGIDSLNMQVPEPSAWLVLGGALFGAGWATRRSRQRSGR